MHLLRTLWNILGAIAALITLPGSVELLVLSLAALLPRRRISASTGPWRVAVVVPAHNEEAVIQSCVASLLSAQGGQMDVAIYVIADHCTDRTAALAASSGAHVILREDPTPRGKGHGLHDAFTQLAALGFDAFLVVDADTIVSSGFLLAAAGTLRSGADAVQVAYTARHGEQTTRTRLLDFALSAFNVVRPLGRERLGLSVGIFGNGFGLRRETLQAVPYLATSLVEDLEYHLALVRSGRRVRFLEQAAVFGEMPVRGKGVKTQRARWEGGRLHMLKTHGPSLFRQFAAGQWTALEPLLDLLLLPLAFHVALLVLAATAHAPLVSAIGLAGLTVVLIHLAVTIAIRRRGWQDLSTLAAAPFYIAWKLLLIPTLLRHASAKQEWVRTTRNAEIITDTSKDRDEPEL